MNLARKKKLVKGLYRPRGEQGPPARVNVGNIHTVKIEGKCMAAMGSLACRALLPSCPWRKVWDEVKALIKAVK